MAISHIGNIAHINQNTLLNSQLQAANLNAQNAQNMINIQEFSQKMQENLEVRKAEESKAIDKDAQNSNKNSESPTNNKKQNPAKKKHLNIYGDDGILDIEVWNFSDCINYGSLLSAFNV